MKQLVSVVIAIILLSSLLLGNIIAEPTALNLNKVALKWDDMSIIDKEGWILYGNEPIMRAELTVVINNIMKLQGKDISNYNDFKEEWYVDYIQKAEKANLLVDSEEKINPIYPITREDAVVVFAKAIGVKVDSSQKDSGFPDNSNISPTAIAYIRAMKDMNNLPFSQEFKPKENMTKGEFLEMFDLSISDIYTDKKIYKDTVENSLVVNTPDVMLKNITINENLIISEGVSLGTITLNNVTVKGQTVIRGGKEIIVTNSKLDHILVETRDSFTKINLDEKSSTPLVKVVESKDGVTIQGNIDTATLYNANSNFNLENGHAQKIEASGEGIVVSVNRTSSVNAVNLNGTSSAVLISGTVNSVYTGEKANNTGVMLTKGAKITTLTKRTDSIVVSNGTISTTNELPAYEPPKLNTFASIDSDMASAEAVGTYLGTFISTAYCIENYHHICNDGDASKTAMGTKPIPYKTIAVDPKVIKLGTKLKIQDATGNIYYVTATDTGGAIKEVGS